MKLIFLSCYFSTFILVTSTAQIVVTQFVLDTSEVKYSSNNKIDYYNEDVVRCKTFYPPLFNKVHYEYIRFDKNCFYAIEYDSNGNKINEGLIKKENKPYNILKMPVFDSNGKEINKKEIKEFKFCKDGYWINYMGSLENYQKGKYIGDIPDSIWVEYKNTQLERKYFWKKGKLEKIETINFFKNSNNKEKMILLSKKWNYMIPNTSPENNKFTTLPTQFQDRQFFELKVDGIARTRAAKENANGSDQTEIKNGFWELSKDGLILSMNFGQLKLKARIEYLSAEYLTISFTE